MLRIVGEEVMPKSGPDYPNGVDKLTPDDLKAFGEKYLALSKVHRRQDKSFFIDKCPYNLWHVGLIHLMLPNARIIDIRRQNMLEHLLYKALMETSADRAEFVSRLFARPRVESAANSTVETLFRAYKLRRRISASLEANIRRVVEYLEHQKGFTLSNQDKAGIRYVAQAFFKSGPDLSYTFIGGYGDFRQMPTYSDLMTETDGASKNWNFLATEDQFQAIQRMQQHNLIVPLVGDFAGPKAIRSVARYVQEHGSTVRVFYTSNVEQYLFQDAENSKRFYNNVAFLPTDSTSTFIRYVVNGWGYGRDRTTMTSTIRSTIGAYRVSRIQAYPDLVSLSALKK